MKNMSLKAISAAVGGVYIGDDAAYHQVITGVETDSRNISAGNLYIALPGARVDGHDFIEQAIAAGALVALSEKKIENATFPYIHVTSCLNAMQALARYYRQQLNIKVVGITGSVGKTSTKEMVASVLSQQFKVLKTAGNHNNEIGLPLTIFRIREEHQIAVLEMGIDDFGDMKTLALIAQPDICLLTNIGVAHIEQLKTRDGILQEKSDMINYMNPQGAVILNGDDDKLITIRPKNGLKPIYFGLDSQFPFWATLTENLGLSGTRAAYHTPFSEFSAHIAIPGEHMIYNALAAIAVAYEFAMDDANIVKGIEALAPLAGRNNMIHTSRYTIIDDCYNANPFSMKASLQVLNQAQTRKVAILGDMGELGENKKAMHKQVGRYVKDLDIDVLIAIGTLATEMVAGAKEKSTLEIHYYETKEEALDNLSQLLTIQDTILVKASNAMGFSEIEAYLQK